jgi:membrane-associated phospholipid phosphatase
MFERDFMVIATPRLAACCCLSFALLASATPALCQTTSAQAPQARTSAVSPVAAPDRPSVADDLFKPLLGDFRQLGSSRNLFLAGVGAGVALSSHPWDQNVARSAWAGEPHDAFEPGKHVGSFLAQSGAAVATYALGRTTGNTRIAAVGARLFRAQIVAQGTTQIIKFATHRTRPDGSALSFPSGHTAAAFATATVLHDEFGWKVGIPAFAMAGWVATSRVQMDRHYLSDVIAGATVGLLAGRSLTVGKASARFSLTPMVVPGGIGVAGVRIKGR